MASAMYGTQDYKLVPASEVAVEGSLDENVLPWRKTFMSSVGKFTIGSIAVAAALVGSAAVLESRQIEADSSAAFDVKDHATTYEKMTHKLSNSKSSGGILLNDEYSRKFGRLISDGLLGDVNNAIAQVHKETTITSLDPGEHTWKVDGILQNDGSPTEEGITVTFTEPGSHVIELVGEGQAFTVHAKRVRRELRDLSDDDRSRYFNAMKTIYTTKNEEGQKIYGANYHSAWWYVAKHLEGAADKECDHWHDDAGIVTHHIAVTWELENTLVSVDPSVAAHYWDYTRDASQAVDDGVSYEDVNVFEEGWFGPVETTEDPEHHVLSQGVFAYTEIIRQDDHTTPITNPYGLLRSPWNTNPTPYVMRHNAVLGKEGDGYSTFPKCTDFQSYLTSDWVGEIFYAINGPLHGSLHLMTGGHWGATEKMVNWIKNEISTPDSFLLFSKFLWRQGYIRTPEMCSSDTPATECIPSCPSDIIRGRSAGEIFNISGIVGISNPFFSSKREDYGVSEKDILDLLCSVGYPGELFTSAAPQDPLFWAIHGNAERFLQLARVLKAKGYLNFDETWGYEHQKIASDTGLVCDWSNATGMEMPKCVFDETCTGHRADDVLPFTKLYDEMEHEFTNVEFYGILDPANAEQIPYVYDSLLYWEGCEDQVLFKVDGFDDDSVSR